MSDGAFPDRLSQLRTRWESDPSSRVFLQLAEEYRHQGQVKEALAVLDKGLQEHPGYLSALVAKGRCHLELREGEAARAVLERVVKQDATQMVANKLLVRAHLETGEPAKARERLDLYSLLNDSDPEIADLRRQIKAMDRPKEPVPEDSPFDLTLGGELSAAAPVNDIFDLGPAPAPAASPAGDGNLLFPELASPVSRQQYLTSLASEGIFEIEPASAPAPSSESADTSWLEEAPAPAEAPPVFDLAPPALEPAPLASLSPIPPLPPMEEAADLWAEDDLTPLPELESASEPEPVRTAEPEATATLGDLYLRQGHLEEAERIYREVLEREPDNSAARAGATRVEEARQPAGPPPVPAPIPVATPFSAPLPAAVDARRLLTGFQTGSTGGGTTARKIFLLNRYLDRIRGGRADVR